MSENEWVKLPDGCESLPKHTRVRGCGSKYEALTEVTFGSGKFSGDGYLSDWHCEDIKHTYRNTAFDPELIERVQLPDGYVFRGSDVAKVEPDDLGDTPDHLKPLLRAARERVPGTVVTESERPYFGCTVQLWGPGNSGYVYDENAHGCGLKTYGTEVFPGSLSRGTLHELIQQGRCYPTADARRIGREEFGMSFAGDVPDVQLGAGEKAVMSPVTIKVSGGILWGDLANPPSADDVREALNRELERAIAGRLTTPRGALRGQCKCGSTTNVNLRLGVCAACHLEKRKAEVRAEMDRPVPKKREESKAPRSWPEGAGDDYEL